MSHTYTNLLYHIVYSTKDRHPWLDATILSRMCEYLGGAIRDEGGIALLINGMPDHIHILAKLRQDKAVSDVVRDIKANSSGWVHREFPECSQFEWQTGYGAFTVSVSQLEKVREYIRNQVEHHRRMSFREEFVGFLKAHGVEFDERYLWV